MLIIQWNARLLKNTWLKDMDNITIIKMAVLGGRKKTRIHAVVIKKNNKNNPLNHHGWEGFVRLGLSFYIDLESGFQFNCAMVIPYGDLLKPAFYKCFIKHCKVGRLDFDEILQVCDSL